MAPSPRGRSQPASDDSEVDYMDMIIQEPECPKIETSLGRRSRLKKEGEIRGHVKTKQERAADVAQARDSALATSIDNSNKGFKMLAKLGYTPGSGLGKRGDASLEPIQLAFREDRGGIGHDSERKRKFQKEVEHKAKKIKVDEGDFRERLRDEREDKRREAQIHAAQKVAERLEPDSEQQSVGQVKPHSYDEQINSASIPLRNINVLWRGLEKERREKSSKQFREHHALDRGLSRNGQDGDPDEDDDDKVAVGKELPALNPLGGDEDEDEELESFNNLPSQERLAQIVAFLRQTHYYCFWCKYQYPSDEMEECPGTTEEDHD